MRSAFKHWLVALAAALVWLPAQQVSGASISNTAFLQYHLGANPATVSLPSNTVTLAAAGVPTPATVNFLAYARGASDAVSTAADGGACADTAGTYSPLPATQFTDGTPLPGTASQPLHEVSVFHAGEPVFIALSDGNRNLDSSVRDSIELLVTTSAGDEEQLRLQETGVDTATFVGVIQSAVAPPAAVKRNCVLSVERSGTIMVRYVDSFYATDIATANVLVDPYGVVFDSRSGAAVNGASVTLINVATGQPATVLGDDGVSSFPSTVITGAPVQDASGLAYSFPPGSFRFPFVPPGQYRLLVQPPDGYNAPSVASLAALQALRDALGNPYSVTLGSLGETFILVPGPALNIDVPVDPLLAVPGQSLIVQKLASRAEASVGDFVQYTVSVRNAAAAPAEQVQLNDVLPVGFRYRATSVRRDGQATAEPTIAADGRNLSFALGRLAGNQTANITYVAEITAGARPGDAVNLASARADGDISSNPARALVRVREAFFGNCGIVVGRVVEGQCNADWSSLKGVANARVMLEDGTYTTTDKDGLYHFEKVCDGTHVVQLDLETLSSELEATPCIQNTRFAGRSFSQFVDMQGGSLWRADFYTRRKPLLQGPVGLRLEATLVPGRFTALPKRHSLKLHFDTRKAKLTSEVKASLDRLVKQLKGSDIGQLRVIGHTDNVRISAEHQNEFADNLELSRARAQSAADYLREKLGLAENAVFAAGRGDTQPIASNARPEGRARNRRVDVLVQPKVSRSTDSQLTYRLEVQGGKAPVNDLRVMVSLPDGVAALPGSVSIDGEADDAAKFSDGTVIVDLGSPGADWTRVVEFSAAIPKASQCAGAGFEARAVAAFSTNLAAKMQTPPVSALLPCPAAVAANTNQLSSIIHFDSRSAALGSEAATTLDALAGSASGQLAKSLSITGHAGGEQLSASGERNLAKARATVTRDYLEQKLSLDDAKVNLGSKRDALPAQASSAVGETNAIPRAEVLLQTVAPAKSTVPAGAVGEAQVQVQARDSSAEHLNGFDLTSRSRERLAIADDMTAAGGSTDFLQGETPGSAWLFPAEDYNPRAPTTRVVIKHAPANTVELFIKDQPVDPLAFDGSQSNAAKTVAVSIWHGLPLAEGDNLLVARERDPAGKLVSTLTRTVHFSNEPIKVEFVPEQSIAISDGVTHPVLALRFTDAAGRPVRAGVTGPYRLDPPFVAAETVRRQQQRQLAGEDSFTPTYKVEGDHGIAYIELQPSTQSGYAELHFAFQQEHGVIRKQDVRAWMASQAHDWVVVGFAEGTLGYSLLDSKAEARAGGERDALYNDGQLAFYAKGWIKGEWLMTMGYDSKKKTNGLRNESLQQVIDPDEYYLIYGDGSEQRYDAPSQRRLYLKLEKDRFFALFGDYETGLTETRLSRYSRALNGIKSQYAGERVSFTLFAADTAQNHVREEIQGNGTSGLYRLGHDRIVINSERISLVVHDRLRSELITDTRSLFRHIDYEIDYSNGTLFFKQPVASRDSNFNPVFIQAEYEVSSGGKQNLNTGARVAYKLLDDKLSVGGSFIRDERDNGKTNLGGVDARLKLGNDTELRMEAALSDSSGGPSAQNGSAFLAELEHHEAGTDLLAYARRQEAGFGVSQQSGFESGTQKFGVSARKPLTEKLAVSGEAYRQESLSTGGERNVGSARAEYAFSHSGRVFAGAQFAQDHSAGRSAESELINLGASDRFLGGKLELQERSDFALGGKDGSVDFPTRHTLQAGYDLTQATKLVVAQEFTQGGSYDSATTRLGALSNPWQGARLNSTLNQSIGEYGPRTFAQYGFSQSFLIGEGWGVDIGLDRSETFHQSGRPPVQVDRNGYPLAAAGINGGGNSAGGVGSSFVEVSTEDFTAVSAGATYRTELWSAALRGEFRDGEREDRQSLSFSLLRQATAGIAVAGSARIFNGSNSAGTSGQYGNASLSIAWRPLASRWNLLERLEYRHDAVSSGTGIPGGGLFGSNSLNLSGSGRSRAIINHLSFNRVSQHWSARDRQGNLFALNQRSQLSVFYGAKYSFDNFNGQDFTGFTDLLGLELRHDLSTTLDIGIQASLLHSWTASSLNWSVGPMLGTSPIDNLWVSVGYNLSGFSDRDFSDATYTAQGPYIKARWKFDQLTRFGEAAASPRALTPQGLAASGPEGGAP